MAASIQANQSIPGILMPQARRSTGCGICDAKKLLACQGHGASAGGGGEGAEPDDKLASENDLQLTPQLNDAEQRASQHHLPFALRYFFESPRPSPDERHTLKTIYEEALVFNKALAPQDKLHIHFENDVLVIEAPTAEILKDFLNHLESKGMNVGNAFDIVEAQSNRSSAFTPWKMTLTRQ